MRTAELTETEHAHRLSENLINQLAKGREWATPGVEAALQRAVAGLDTGIETASPRLQALLRRLADELAGGVETYTPRVQERLRRVGPKAAPVAARAPRRAGRMLWWVGALMALAGGAAVWRSMQASKKEPAPPLESRESSSADPNVDADLASGRM
ncbi:hypothetical protein QFZ60_000725 [Arthrobacter sp. B2I5]|uniref:hypothetical protein n=1 Tax=Arthrobacter sp. B2I5 TaxID=3042266 RepID=UPI002783517B|nr:hypothetical protein [Arthrobacter sp. B2I5]MDQ0824552.1 hypothetical protein [Arthrobacter sp. B2I5]